MKGQRRMQYIIEVQTYCYRSSLQSSEKRGNDMRAVTNKLNESDHSRQSTRLRYIFSCSSIFSSLIQLLQIRACQFESVAGAKIEDSEISPIPFCNPDTTATQS